MRQHMILHLIEHTARAHSSLQTKCGGGRAPQCSQYLVTNRKKSGKSGAGGAGGETGSKSEIGGGVAVAVSVRRRGGRKTPLLALCPDALSR